MDTIESKLNVIYWLTDYKGKITKNDGKQFIELNHKSGFNKWIFSYGSIEDLMRKLDNFIEKKLSTKLVSNPGENLH